MRSLRDLEMERGITASARSEVYGCLFGRDSLITALALLSFSRRSGDRSYMPLVQKILKNLAELQGTQVNIESGEEPGKCIHEYRTDAHEHLTKGKVPWFLYPDGSMRNYDSVDATPLFLMAFYEYYTLSGDFFFVEEYMRNIRSALSWLFLYADKDDDGLVDYSFHPKRVYGGLKTQSWMDSTESVFFEDSAERPAYPIAPIEVQAYTYTALKQYADFFKGRELVFSRRLVQRAEEIKIKFNQTFVKRQGRSIAVAYAVDGAGTPLWSTRSSIGHCLWASYRGGPVPESIIDSEHIPALARRLMRPDLFVKGAGLRTLSSNSKRYNPISYHNGSIWPHDSALVAEGLDTFGYESDAKKVRKGLVNAYKHFETPIELYGYEGGFKEYEGVDGGRACRVQAWSAASILTTLHGLGL